MPQIAATGSGLFTVRPVPDYPHRTSPPPRSPGRRAPNPGAKCPIWSINRGSFRQFTESAHLFWGLWPHPPLPSS